MTCGFDRSPKISLTVWLAFWLAHLCDVDHIESRSVWCRTALCSIQAVYPGALPGVDAGPTSQAITKTGCWFREADVASLSRFVRHHVNMLGRSCFQLPGLPGGLRQLRGPGADELR